MSNHPKIVYRSDTTGRLYKMILGHRTFRIIVTNLVDEQIGESPEYACKFPWMQSICWFFDICEQHINGRPWARS